MAFTTVPTTDFAITAGADQIRIFPSTSFGRRQFCGACGTPLAMRVDHEPDTLHDPFAVAPKFHIFYGQRIPWFETTDSLPRHDRSRP